MIDYEINYIFINLPRQLARELPDAMFLLAIVIRGHYKMDAQSLLDTKVLRHNLKHLFGFDDFRPGQLEVIESILRGEHVLSVMPTGSGKSLCYQLPAASVPSQTIVVSPIIALMNDQVMNLRASGVRAETIHSGNSREENIDAWMRFIASAQLRGSWDPLR